MVPVAQPNRAYAAEKTRGDYDDFMKYRGNLVPPKCVDSGEGFPADTPGRHVDMTESINKLREKWPWNPEFLRLALAVTTIIGVVATLATFPWAGLHSLWFLSTIFVGVIMYAVFSAVGKKVVSILRQAEREDGDCVQSLIVIGGIQSPGIALLHKNELHLRPIVGSEVTIDLNNLISVNEGRWLPGKFVWGKRAFILETEQVKRLAFAVPESVGFLWSPKIQGRIQQRHST